MSKKNVSFVTLVTITLAIIITLIYEFNLFTVSPSVMIGVRWVTAAVLTLNALMRKNLTTWILTCLILGVFVGLDFPNLAISLHPLS